ncbi:hypothetical protein LZ30DRAFT_5198 [Colletotrichum cereale]|nr:hypothetical protein LZ30DRAFT_5198 [Colletotrichum cereale]
MHAPPHSTFRFSRSLSAGKDVACVDETKYYRSLQIGRLSINASDLAFLAFLSLRLALVALASRSSSARFPNLHYTARLQIPALFLRFSPMTPPAQPSPAQPSPGPASSTSSLCRLARRCASILLFLNWSWLFGQATGAPSCSCRLSVAVCAFPASLDSTCAILSWTYYP